MFRRIAVNTGGGDAPGLNAVIRAVALSGIQRGWEVIGIRHGYRGMLEDDPAGLIRLDKQAVRGITHLGGTILGSASKNDPFHYPVNVDGKLVPTDVSEHLVRRFHELKIDGMVAIGGDGSINLSARLLEKGLPQVVSVPKTIDNDLPGTDRTFGFDTAVAAATDAIDRLHSTTEAHERVMVLELMGRYAGWIALYAGVAGGADVILLPEIPFDIDRVCEKVIQREREGRRFSIVVVAEGARPSDGERSYRGARSAFREHAQLGGMAERVAEGITERTGKETRSLVLGHLQRGGTPVMSDRALALQLGCAATEYLARESKASGLVAVRNNSITVVPLREGTGGIRTVPADDPVLMTARQLGLCLGDEPAGSFVPDHGAPTSA